MSANLDRTLATKARVHQQLSLAIAPRGDVDRTFQLPTALYAVTVACYLGFIAVLGLGLATPGLGIPMAIFALFIVAGFGVPALWVRMKPLAASKALGWDRFVHEGIATHTGRATARDASVQMLILPVLILCWGVAVLVLRAAVG